MDTHLCSGAIREEMYGRPSDSAHRCFSMETLSLGWEAFLMGSWQISLAFFFRGRGLLFRVFNFDWQTYSHSAADRTAYDE